MTSGTKARDRASELCISCGLCCQGLLHRYVAIQPGEGPLLEKLELDPRDHGERSVFELPCHHLGSEGCRVYTERPATCRSYRCQLLKDYLENRIDQPTAKQRIDRARELMITISNELQARPQISSLEPHSSRPRRRLWQELADRTSPEDSPEQLMDVAELRTICGRYFENRSSSRNSAGLVS